MIKREHLKKAVEAVVDYDPAAAFTLDAMLNKGLIDAPYYDQIAESEHNFFFYLDNKKILVPKFRFFNEGLRPLEERLLIKYGELKKRNELSKHRREINFREAALTVNRAGLEYFVNLELKKSDLLLDPDRNIRISKPANSNHAGASMSPNVLNEYHDTAFTGTINADDPALFTRFPYTFDALCQVAELNLEFFSVPFLLDLLKTGGCRNVFCCIADNSILGLTFLISKRESFYTNLEIKYIATQRGRIEAPGDVVRNIHKGVGTFLTAGAWMFWKERARRLKKIVLDSEIKSHAFYESTGFKPKGRYSYTLESPGPLLLKNIIIMAENDPETSKRVTNEIAGRIKKLSRLKKTKKTRKQFEQWIDMLNHAVQASVHKEIRQAGLDVLQTRSQYIPELKPLYEMVLAEDKTPLGNARSMKEKTLVVHDQRYARHLESVFCQDSAKRIQAVESILSNQYLKDVYEIVPPRLASTAELKSVHTSDYIDMIERTAGRTLTSLDMDTHTSARSNEIARLAVGGVLNLVDEIQSGSNNKGIAFIRPPGHHARPDKAMGFCLFNNAALAADYLINQHKKEKVAIVDIDAHHGNGTQEIFYNRKDVLYFSLHQFPHYPGSGALGEIGEGPGTGFTVNVPLGKRQSDMVFLQILHFILRPVIKDFKPDIILTSCGFDLYHHDPTSEMNATPEGYGHMTALLNELADEFTNGRIVYILEGGYSLKGLRECGLQVMRELTGNGDRQSSRRVHIATPKGDIDQLITKVLTLHSDRCLL